MQSCTFLAGYVRFVLSRVHMPGSAVVGNRPTARLLNFVSVVV